MPLGYMLLLNIPGLSVVGDSEALFAVTLL